MGTKKNFLYYSILIVIGYFIYKFQIEKSFNLLTIYTLCVSVGFISFLFKIDSKKTLPLLFVLSLFAMYGVSNQAGEYKYQLQAFFLLLSLFALMLFILIATYRLVYKKIVVLFFSIALASVYFWDSEGYAEYKYLPFVIGSFFMFRSISFLHEIKFLKQEVPLIDKINYFLLSPNFSMPLFPIVDFKAFISSYEGINTNTLSRGCIFICRGLFQLILYRFIYHQLIIPFDEIQTALQVFIFIIANFMIVLRVIGAYHIAIGLVILTGYNIPDIFNNIFFSTSFSDLWRRINIYWLNFMLKLFYYPLYFKLKKIGIYKGLFISTFLCFVITWFLHAYQWFWLKGVFPIELSDAIFWLGFGVLVSMNTLIQQRKLEQTENKKEEHFQLIRKAISGLGILLVMSFLWSIWTSGSVQNWWELTSNFKKIDLHQAKIILALLLVYILIATGFHYVQLLKKKKFATLSRNLLSGSIFGFVTFFILLNILNTKIIGRDKSQYRKLMDQLTSEQQSKADLIAIDNGYYSNLINTNKYCSQVWVNDFDISRRWTKYISAQTTAPSYDLFLRKGIPLASVKYNNVNYTLNSIGLRDKEYPKNKADSVYRIVILGGSYECGNGMNDGEDFISLVEAEINEGYISTINGKRIQIELINFSSNGYFLIQRLHQYIDNARAWKPDALFLFIHSNYQNRMVTYIRRLLQEGYVIKDPYLNYVINVTGIKKADPLELTRTKLSNYVDSLNYYAIDRINSIATKQDHIVMFPVYLPALKDRKTNRDSVFIENICSRFSLDLINLSDAYKGEEIAQLTISDVDFHPNKKANRLIANELLERIINHQEYFNIQFIKK